jgi:hypothetical protein
MFHLAEYHADWGNNNPTLLRIPGKLLVDSFITSEEESLMGIDEMLTDEWREDNNIPDTDRIEEMQEDLRQARAESNVSGGGGRVRKSHWRLVDLYMIGPYLVVVG